MKDRIESAISLHQAAKGKLNRAETEWRKTLNTYNRLHRERFRNKGEITEAELAAERAYKAASAALEDARDNWTRVQITVPRPRRRTRTAQSDSFQEDE